jgi:4-amino-4-deoxy-L-arabinose transferase-like glycosyltransferase
VWEYQTVILQGASHSLDIDNYWEIWDFKTVPEPVSGKNFLPQDANLTPVRHHIPPISLSSQDWDYLVRLSLLAVPLLVYHLGSAGLMDPDEGRYAEIAREMLVLKDWLAPHLNFLPYLEKPPLVYWLTALSFQVFGFSEWAARLPAAMSALGGVFLAYFLGRAFWGARAGFWSALILATSGGFVVLGRLIILDMPLTFFLNLGVGLGYLAAVRERRSLLVWAYLALAGAMLIKGPVALVLAGLIWGIWTLLERRRSLRFWLHPGGLALMAVVMLPWFILISLRFPEFPKFFLWEHHVGRYVAGTIHGKPFYYYGPVLLGLMMPWSWLLPWALGRLKPAASPERPFLLIWAGVILLFFSISGGKLAPYILPALLPLALLMGEALTGLSPDQSILSASPGLTASLAVWGVAATALAVLYFWPPAFLAAKLTKMALLRPFVPVGLVILAITPGAALVWRRPAPLLLGALLLSALLPGGMERLSATRSPKELGLTVRSLWQPGAALVGVRLYSQGLSFYARQPLHLLEFDTELDFGRELRPDSGLYFSTPEDMAAFAVSKPLVFFFLKKKAFPRLQEWLPGKYHFLASWKDCLLTAYTGE